MNTNQGNDVDWVEVDETVDFPYPVEPQVSIHELTYGGRVDIPAGSQLGPGIDGRYATVAGCIFDNASGKTTVIVEAITPVQPALDPMLAAWVSTIVTSYNQYVETTRELAAAMA